VVAVVTQPAKPVGRQQILTPTPVETWARNHTLTVLSFPSQTEKPWIYEDEQSVIDALQPLKADLLVSASYGQKIPTHTVIAARFGGVNVHPSLLPCWRGADPVPWAINSGDRQTGVTIVRLSAKFDQGSILSQEKINISDSDVTETLRARLFTMGADLLIKILPDILSGKIKGTPQKIAGTPYARRLTRDDGFEPWEKIMDPKESERINRKYRAFHPWPGLWSIFNGKRIKILNFIHSPVTLQLEGKKPVPFTQFQSAYLPS
jgi:methionyl-tRNA formyltransferase